MICNNCQCQIYDGANFCPNCGVQFNPYISRPYQPQTNYNLPGNDVNENEKLEKSIFILGLVSFCVHLLYFFIDVLHSFFGLGWVWHSGLIYSAINLASIVVIVFLSFLFVKKQSYKTPLLIFSIVLFVLGLYHYFFR